MNPDDKEHEDTLLPDDDRENVQNDLTSVTFVPRKYITKSKITLEHANRCINVGEEITLEEKAKQLELIKDQAKQWFRNEIGKLITNIIQQKDLTYNRVILKQIRRFPVRNLDEFTYRIEQDASDEFMKILYEVSYGFFDENPDWSLDMEADYMKRHRFQYSECKTIQHRAREKGCFEILCCQEKTEVVKRFQRISKRCNGKYVSITLDKNKNGRYTKRMKGRFYEDFIKYDEKAIGGKISTITRQYQVN